MTEKQRLENDKIVEELIKRHPELAEKKKCFDELVKQNKINPNEISFQFYDRMTS